MHIQKIVSGIRELQVMHTETKNNEIRRKKAQQKKIEAMIEEKEKDTDFFIEKMRLKKEKDRLIQKKILEREKENEEDREEEIDKARVRSKMELEKKNNKSASLRASRGATSAVNASRLYLLLSVFCTLCYLSASSFSLLCSSFSVHCSQLLFAYFNFSPLSSLLSPLSTLLLSPLPFLLLSLFSLLPSFSFPPFSPIRVVMKFFFNIPSSLMSFCQSCDNCFFFLPVFYSFYCVSVSSNIVAI
jgi:hypothetical protein